jgi:transcription elongation factor
MNKTHINKPIPKLRESPQPPLSHAGAPAEADRAKRPSLVQPSAPHAELNPGDRVEGLGNFGMPTGQLGTVEQANEEDAVVKWDDDGRMRLRQPWLKKVSKKAHPLAT